MKATAIIQARMTSSRLPGKVLMRVSGRSLLSYQIERIRFCNSLENIVIATTINPEDGPVVELAQKERVKYYRGSELDVLDRFYRAAREYEAEHVIRLTGDCPLIYTDVLDKILAVYEHANADYVYTGQSFAEGLDCEVFHFKALKKAWKEAMHASEREHVTLFFRNHPDRFSHVIVENETDDSMYRITVDEDKDFRVVHAVFENLYAVCKPYIRIQDIKTFLKSRPDIYALNADIVRNEGLLKSIAEDRIIS